MKKYVAPLALLGALSLGACSEDFELAAPYKNVTVVYGMLNPADTSHYIRIQKAFLDESKSAIDMAKNPDSNFYRSLRVDIKEINSNNTVISTISNINRVDMANEGFPKAPGSFFNTPNYAYKFKAILNPNSRYRVVITNLETGNVDSAETNIISNDPNDFKVAQFPAPPLVFTMAFTNTKPLQNFNLDITKFPGNNQILEGIMHFRYVDKNTVTGVQTDQMVEWRFAEKLREGSSQTNAVLSVPILSFYSFLQGSVPPAPANTERYLDSADLYIWSANQDYVNYRNATFAAGGITGDQVKPIYTNIKGKDVLGLFAARTYVYTLEAAFNSPTLDTIKSRPETRNLKFVGFSDH